MRWPLFIRRTTAANVILVLLCLCQAARPPQKKTRSSAKSPAEPDPIPDGPPYTLEKIISLLDRVKQGKFARLRLEDLVRKRGVEFSVNAENMQKLKDKEAWPDLLSLIQEKAPHQQPPPEPKREVPVVGTLAISCSPPECDVHLKGQNLKTSQGKVTIPALPVGPLQIEVTKDGYTSQSFKPEISASTPPLDVKLTPTAETKANMGQDLLARMRKAIGFTGVARLRSMSGKGSMASVDGDGKQSAWNLSLEFTPQRVTFRADNQISGLPFILSCVGQTCVPQKTGGKFSGRKQLTLGESKSIRESLDLFWRYHVMAILERLGDSSLRASADPESGSNDSNRMLHLETNVETLEITISQSLQPERIAYKPKVGSGADAYYSDYVQVGDFSYPRRTSIKVPDSNLAISVTLDTPTPGASPRN